jgi:hypothetical protein
MITTIENLKYDKHLLELKIRDALAGLEQKYNVDITGITIIRQPITCMGDKKRKYIVSELDIHIAI